MSDPLQEKIQAILRTGQGIATGADLFVRIVADGEAVSLGMVGAALESLVASKSILAVRPLSCCGVGKSSDWLHSFYGLPAPDLVVKHA